MCGPTEPPHAFTELAFTSNVHAPLQVNPVEAKLAKWTRCNLSGEILHPPCVADELGNLYNKDAMVQALVTKSLPASLSYISTLKHLIDLRYVPVSKNFQHFACLPTSIATCRFPNGQLCTQHQKHRMEVDMLLSKPLTMCLLAHKHCSVLVSCFTTQPQHVARQAGFTAQQLFVLCYLTTYLSASDHCMWLPQACQE